MVNRWLSSWPLGKILTGPVHSRVALDTFSGYPESWSSKISMCQNPEKKSHKLATPQKWQSPRLATPKKMAESPTLVSLGVASPGLCHFFGVASLDFRHIGKFGGGKKDQTPCSKHSRKGKVSKKKKYKKVDRVYFFLRWKKLMWKKNVYKEQRLFFQRQGKIQMVTKIRNFLQIKGFGSHNHWITVKSKNK